MDENTEEQSTSAFRRGAVPDFEADAWLSSIVIGAEDAIVGKTLDGDIVSWNPAAERLFGYRAEEVLGKPVSLLADPALPNEMPDILERLRRGQRVPGYETTRRRKDGTLIPVWLSISPIRNRGGKLVGTSKIARDITKQKKTEEQLRLLSADMAHRTKNTLAIILAIVRLTKRKDVTEYRKAIEDRLLALDRANSLLSDGNWESAGLEDIIRQTVETFRIQGDRFTVGGPPVSLRAEAAGTLSITVHELATNALKHGALSREGGTIGVDWETRADGVHVRWCERNGPPAWPPRRKSLGLIIMQAGIEKQLDGTLRMDWSEAGITCDIMLHAKHIVG